MKRLPAIKPLPRGVSALALAAVGLLAVPAAPARAQSFTVQSGQTVAAQTMNFAGDTGTVEPGGTINGGAAVAVQMLAIDQTLTIGGIVNGGATAAVLSTGDNASIANSGLVTANTNEAIRSNGDNAWIDNTGTITTTGVGVQGILSQGDNVWINHSGTITTQDNASDGIFAVTGVNARITSSGTIITNGDSARGLRSAGDNAWITHSGAITTTGAGSEGLFSQGDNAWITSSGTITTTGFNSEGLGSSGDNAWISHTGTITTTGSNSEGLNSSGANAWISNTGTITTSQFAAVGISSSGVNARISNSGAITTSGSIGISSIAANGQVTNSGRIISPQAQAIRFAGNHNNILTLLPGSVLQGGLEFGGGVDTLKVGNGLSISNTFDKAPEFLNTYGAPFAINGTQVAVADPTTLSAQEESFADLTGGIFSTVQNRLSALRNGVVGVTGNPRPMYVAGEEGGMNRTRQYWVQGFGSYRGQEGDGPSLDTDQHVVGFVSGVDAQASAATRVGFFLGGSFGQVENALETQETDTDSVFGGVYASTLRGRTAIDAALTVGWSDYDREREVANNLVAGGLQTASASFDGIFISPEVTFTRPFWPLGARVEKVVTLRYAGLFLDGFTETGAADAFSVGDRDIHLGVARAALALPIERQSEDGGHSRLTLTGGVEGRAQFGDETLSGTLLAQNISFDPGGDDGAVAGFAGITGEHTTPRGMTVFVSLEGKIEDDGSHQASARGGVKVSF